MSDFDTIYSEFIEKTNTEPLIQKPDTEELESFLYDTAKYFYNCRSDIKNITEDCGQCYYKKEIERIRRISAPGGMEQNYYETITSKDKDEKFIEWGAGLKIIIVCDKGTGRARALSEFLTEKTQFDSVTVIKNMGEFEAYIKTEIPDILIFAALQNNLENYKIFDKLKEVNPLAFQAMYAARDKYVESICAKNEITCIGDCKRKTAHFINMLKENYIYHRIICRELELQSSHPSVLDRLSRFFK